MNATLTAAYCERYFAMLRRPGVQGHVGSQMPNGWVHATNSLIAFGRPYFDDHRQKDAPARFLGSRHRMVNHDYYQAYEISWTLDNPFPPTLNKRIQAIAIVASPDAAEREQVSTSHDYLDRLWDTLNFRQRKCIEGAMLLFLLNPESLSRLAGVDLIEGGIQRFVDGREIWEPCPELKAEYYRLRRYGEVVGRKDPILRSILRHY